MAIFAGVFRGVSQRVTGASGTEATTDREAEQASGAAGRGDFVLSSSWRSALLARAPSSAMSMARTKWLIALPLLLFLSTSVLHLSLLHLRNAKKTPVILIPGDGGSQLFAKLNKSEVVHYFCDKKTDTYFSLWLNMELLVPLVIDCWVDNMRLVYDNVTRTTANSPGVDITVPGFGNTSTVEYVDPSNISIAGYFYAVVNILLANGYTRGLDIHGAPYDFRRSPTELAAYYVEVKELIEHTFVKNDEKVALICHSMGCQVMLYFLNHQSQEWKDKYIHSLVTLGAPWGGAVKAIKAFVSGDNLGMIVVPALTVRTDERTFPSLAFLLPSDKFWPQDEVLMSIKGKNYTSGNYYEMFQDINYTTGYEMWLDNRNLTYNLTHPGVNIHCIHGVGVNTVEGLQYNKFPDHQPKIFWGDGDSTVNTRSLTGCLRWQNVTEKQVNHLAIPGVDHMSVMTDARILKYIQDVLLTTT